MSSMTREKLNNILAIPDLQLDEKVVEFLEIYSKADDIIQRTYAAMGRKRENKIISAGLNSDDKPIANIYASTH